MTDLFDSKELLEMKEQLTLLNKKLEKQTIVNERLIRHSMKEKANWLQHSLIIESIGCLIMIPLFIWVMPTISKISIHFCIFTAIIMVLAIFYNYYMYKRFSPNKFIVGNLIEVRKDTLNFKKQTLRWAYCIGLPFLFIYIPWFVYEKTQYYQGELLKIVLISGGIGLIIGIGIGVHHLMKTIRTTNDILKQIEEIKE